ncbi:neuferricin-like [Lingula anatina]|uniref:Neuferricin-like n=1 Tax=Lingula anatina TaxID=7574 RepID=A0A1S3I280_LINAN|nr:neuferricin-like [Lingula anatina]|eukprot:XP_013392353.1 neuferricin-like [Lingula anatina]
MGIKTTILSFLVVVVALFLTLEVFQPQRDFLSSRMNDFLVLVRSLGSDSKSIHKVSKKTSASSKIFTKDELATFDGSESSNGLYLAIFGKIYDVSKGHQHYGPGGGYHFFVGKDGTRAFVTGEFTSTGLIDDVTGLEHKDMLGLTDWVKFYESSYKYVGKVIGNFYDSEGKPTPALHQARKAIKVAEKHKKADEDDRHMYPACNSEWAQGKGGRLWCSPMSGGIERDWSGVPRRYYKPGSTQSRCACIKTSGPPSDNPLSKEHKNRGDLDNPNFRLYDNCDPMSDSCRIT